MSASPTSPVLKLDHSRSDAVNLAVLQQKDAAVVRVLGTAKHCTLYDFDGRWVSVSRSVCFCVCACVFLHLCVYMYVCVCMLVCTPACSCCLCALY